MKRILYSLVCGYYRAKIGIKIAHNADEMRREMIMVIVIIIIIINGVKHELSGYDIHCHKH